MHETVLQKRRRYLRENLRQKALQKLSLAVKKLYEAGAEEVYIFGSVLKPELFDENSDIDIAVKGIPQNKKTEAYTAVEEILSEFKFDLIFLDEEVRQEIKNRIAEKGVLWKP